ncbi:hypothetical protein Tco_0951810 [Tanacetum coccineum]|uniref:Uncharacterized protein n=1 Tax=Tanacetum coccineum TaxID=301880 RepID=A0ABQ5DV89_9ASTR
MASFDYRLNPLYAIKECSSCGALYTTDYCCSKGSLVDKIIRERPPQNCATCGDPVDGLYCRPCAFVRKCLNEGWYTIHDENEILNTSESSNDNTNIVSAPQEPFVFNQDPGKNSSQSPPHIDHHCCYECGDSLDDIFCQRCTFCNNNVFWVRANNVVVMNMMEFVFIVLLEMEHQSIFQLRTLLTILQVLQTTLHNPNTYHTLVSYVGTILITVTIVHLKSRLSTIRTRVSIKTLIIFHKLHRVFHNNILVDDSSNVFNPPPQPPMYSCEFCGNDARYGHYCTPQVPFIYPEPCYNQDFNFPQDFHDFQQQYLCCENCGGPHETFQCQPMNEDYYHEQNSCYDSNSFGFDQFQPPQYTVNHPIFNAQNELLNSQNKIIEQMTSICDMVGQYMQKKAEDRRIREDQAAKDRYWKIPICYEDVEDYTIAITPVLSTEEPVDSLIMEDEHLDAILATESDRVIKSSVENLVLTPSESEGIPDSMCDVPLCNNPTPLEAFKEHSEIVVDFSDDSTSSDGDSPYGEDIDYVNASPPDSELVRLEVVENVTPEDREIEDDVLREKLSKINLLIAKIKELKDNLPLSSGFVTKSFSISLNLFLEETNTFDNSLPESETFCFNLEEISSGSTTTRSDLFLLDYEAFYDHIEEKSSGSTTTHADFSQYDLFIFDLLIDSFPPADRSDFYHEEFADELAHIISPPKYDCFYFKSEPNPGELTSIVDSGIRENISSTINVNLPF